MVISRIDGRFGRSGRLTARLQPEAVIRVAASHTKVEKSPVTLTIRASIGICPGGVNQPVDRSGSLNPHALPAVGHGTIQDDLFPGKVLGGSLPGRGGQLVVAAGLPWLLKKKAKSRITTRDIAAGHSQIAVQSWTTASPAGVAYMSTMGPEIQFPMSIPTP